MDQQLHFIDGFFPLDNGPIYLQSIKTECGRSADIHLFTGDSYDWVLLLDASVKEAESSLLQQKTNELSLLRKKVLDLWNGLNEEGMGEEFDHNLLESLELKRLTEVSVLSMEIRSVGEKEYKLPEMLYSIFDRYLNLILVPVSDAGGIVLSICGTVITAVFGVLPGTVNIADQSLNAAMRVAKIIREIKDVYPEARKDFFEFSAGIASGQVMLGLNGSQKKRVNVFGYPVEEVSKLLRQAGAFKIVIDLNTLDKFSLDNHRELFSEISSNPGECSNIHRRFSCIAG